MTAPWRAAVRTLEERFWVAGVAANFARALGLDPSGQQALGIVAAELTSNAVKYAGGGTASLGALEDPASARRGVAFEIEDEGPGIAALEQAWRDGVSEGRELTPDTPRAERRGLGLGLGAVLRLADEVVVSTGRGCGTKIRVVFWVKEGARPSPDSCRGTRTRST